jgi:hypothetical protein
MDPFTKASPTYIAAQRTNNARGEAMEWSEGQSLRPWFIAGACVLLFVAMCAICAVSG